jgi:uncharacterized protein (DUF1800 family)
MSACSFYRLILTPACALLGLLAGCATPATDLGKSVSLGASQPSPVQIDSVNLLNRVTWGVNVATAQQVDRLGLERYLDQQLHPTPTPMPAVVEAQIASMTISQRSIESLTQELEQSRKETDAIANDDEKKIARQTYQQELNRLAREAATRSLLRSLYSPNQLQEQMTWFWMNHFNVHSGKHNLRALVGDYEERAIRPHALGKFRDLLAATVHHPAMLRYLDNEQNAINHINENYARELMELHTLGVTGGYSQRDVQELARILTGVGVNLGSTPPKTRRDLQAQYVRQGLFEFNPNRHDYGDKQLLGQTVRGRGLAELDEAIDRLSRHSATARFICGKLAIYFVSDAPPAPLVERMSQTFQRTDGDIAATMRTLLTSAEFTQSLGQKFKDPLHYVVSAVRLAYDDKPILNVAPMLNWLNRMGEPLFGRQTPDGYPLVEAAWASPGQMTTRFDIAKAIGSGNAGLFKTDEAQPQERPAFPQLANPLYFQSVHKTLSQATLQAMDQAGSQQEWNTFLLSSPEMMHR